MGPIVSPTISGCERVAIDNGSVASAYSNGDRGHPCLVPLVTENCSDVHPFANTLATGVWYSSCTHFINLGPRPNFAGQVRM